VKGYQFYRDQLNRRVFVQLTSPPEFSFHRTGRPDWARATPRWVDNDRSTNRLVGFILTPGCARLWTISPRIRSDHYTRVPEGLVRKVYPAAFEPQSNLHTMGEQLWCKPRLELDNLRQVRHDRLNQGSTVEICIPTELGYVWRPIEWQLWNTLREVADREFATALARNQDAAALIRGQGVVGDLAHENIPAQQWADTILHSPFERTVRRYRELLYLQALTDNTTSVSDWFAGLATGSTAEPPAARELDRNPPRKLRKIVLDDE